MLGNLFRIRFEICLGRKPLKCADEQFLFCVFQRFWDELTHPVNGLLSIEVQVAFGQAGKQGACAADAGHTMDSDTFLLP